MDSLFGLRYIVSQRDLSNEKNYSCIVTALGTSVYKNPYALPIAMFCPDDLCSTEMTSDVFENQNTIWKRLSGDDTNVFDEEQEISFTLHNSTDSVETTKEEAQSTSIAFSNAVENAAQTNSSSGVEKDDALNSFKTYIEYTFCAKKDGPIYSYNQYAVSPVSGSEKCRLIYIGNYHKGDKVTQKIYINDAEISAQSFNDTCAVFHVAYANMDALRAMSMHIQDEPITINKDKDSYLNGTVNMEKDGNILFTIPYDAGWTITIDGQKVKPEKALNLFMTIPVTAGSHTYTMTFIPSGLKIGALFSAIGFGLFIILLFFSRAEKRNGDVR